MDNLGIARISGALFINGWSTPSINTHPVASWIRVSWPFSGRNSHGVRIRNYNWGFSAPSPKGWSLQVICIFVFDNRPFVPICEACQYIISIKIWRTLEINRHRHIVLITNLLKSNFKSCQIFKADLIKTTLTHIWLIYNVIHGIVIRDGM